VKKEVTGDLKARQSLRLIIQRLCVAFYLVKHPVWAW